MAFLCTDHSIVSVNAALTSLFTALLFRSFHSSSVLNSCCTPDLDRGTAYCAPALLSTNARCMELTVADPGGGKGVEMHPPFEGLPSHVLSKSAQT